MSEVIYDLMFHLIKTTVLPFVFFFMTTDKNNSVTPYVFFHDVTPYVFFMTTDKNNSVTPYVFFHDDR